MLLDINDLRTYDEDYNLPESFNKDYRKKKKILKRAEKRRNFNKE